MDKRIADISNKNLALQLIHAAALGTTTNCFATWNITRYLILIPQSLNEYLIRNSVVRIHNIRNSRAAQFVRYITVEESPQVCYKYARRKWLIIDGSAAVGRSDCRPKLVPSYSYNYNTICLYTNTNRPCLALEVHILSIALSPASSRHLLNSIATIHAVAFSFTALPCSMRGGKQHVCVNDRRDTRRVAPHSQTTTDRMSSIAVESCSVFPDHRFYPLPESPAPPS